MDELDNYKKKEKENVKGHIKDIYKQDDQEMEKTTMNKEGQVQKKEIFLYKPIDVVLPRPKISESTFIQDEINNLKKYMKYMQAPVKTM